MDKEAKFTPRLEILPLAQRRLWDEFTTIPPEFVLYGGTAIALHLATASLSISTSLATARSIQRG
jgi:hypothetical protein